MPAAWSAGPRLLPPDRRSSGQQGGLHACVEFLGGDPADSRRNPERLQGAVAVLVRRPQRGGSLDMGSKLAQPACWRLCPSGTAPSYAPSSVGASVSGFRVMLTLYSTIARSDPYRVISAAANSSSELFQCHAHLVLQHRWTNRGDSRKITQAPPTTRSCPACCRGNASTSAGADEGPSIRPQPRRTRSASRGSSPR